MASYLSCYLFFEREWGYGLSQKPFISLPLNCAFGVIDDTANVASLLSVVSGNIDDGPSHRFWQQHRPQTRPLGVIGPLTQSQIST